jgi:transcriptional regulator with XRE-family HTH domain
MVHCLAPVLAFLGYNPLPEAEDLMGKFKRARSSLGLTQEHLAGRLGIDESTIAHWEKGFNQPTGTYRNLVERFVAGNGSVPDSAGEVAEDAFSPKKLVLARKEWG